MLSSCFAEQNIYVMTVDESRKHVVITYRDEIEKRDFRTGSFVQIRFTAKHLSRRVLFPLRIKTKTL